VVVPANDVRDPEVDVVDHAREVVRRRPVLADERRPVEALAELRGRLDVPRSPLALAGRAFVPREPEPVEVFEQRLFPTRDVAGGVGVVDPQQQPVAERAVRDGAERVAHVQRAGRARSEAHLLRAIIHAASVSPTQESSATTRR
jgi:hypothetical protein